MINRRRATAVVFALLMALAVVARPIRAQILDATKYPGADIGAQVNAAIAALPGGCGTVSIAAGAYAQTSTIIKPRCVSIKGEGAFGTQLQWKNAEGVAVLVEDNSDYSPGKALVSAANVYGQGEISDLTLEGSGAGKKTIGIYIGGDPTGSTVKIYAHGGPTDTVVSSKAYGDHQNFNRIRDLGFGIGVQWGNHAFINAFTQSIIAGHTTGIFYPAGLVDSGENMTFVKDGIGSSKVGLEIDGFSDFYFFALSCDYNTSVCGNVTSGRFYGSHFEQYSGTVLNIAGTYQPEVQIVGGVVALTCSPKGTPCPSSDPQIFNVPSNTAAPNPSLVIQDVQFSSGHTYDYLVNWKPSGGLPILAIEDLPFPSNDHGLVWNALMNAPCNFYGCRIVNVLGQNSFGGAHTRLAADGTLTTTSVNTSSLQVNNGAVISNSSAVPQVGSPIAGHAACIKAAGPPVVIGYCSTAVSATGACTCN
jgi:hypothetical protein